MHTKQFYRLRNVHAGYVLYRALVDLVFVSNMSDCCTIPQFSNSNHLSLKLIMRHRYASSAPTPRRTVWRYNLFARRLGVKLASLQEVCRYASSSTFLRLYLRFHTGFQDFRQDFKISRRISRFQWIFRDSIEDFGISTKISGFQRRVRDFN